MAPKHEATPTPGATSQEEKIVSESIEAQAVEVETETTPEKKSEGNVEIDGASQELKEEELRAEMGPENQSTFSNMTSAGKKVMARVASNWQEMSVKIYEGSMGAADRTFRGGDNILEKSKKVAGAVYDGLYKIPGVRRIIGKMEIGYSQMWINSHEKKGVKAKKDMDDTVKDLQAYNRQKATIESIVERLKLKGMSTESMQLEIKEIERKKTKLLYKKDQAQSKLEEVSEKAKLYTNERDRVADKLLGSYNEKLQPLEARLESLKSGRDTVELQLAWMEKEHKEEAAELAAIKKEKDEMEEGYRMMNLSEKQISKKGSIKNLDALLAKGYEKMRADKGELMRKMNEIDKRIAKFDEKAAPSRDKREELIRIKEGRPLKFDVENRTSREDYTKRERATVYAREIEPREKKTEDLKAGEPATVKPNETVSREAELEGAQEQEMEKIWTTKELLGAWNKHLDERYGRESADEKIDINDFITIMERLSSGKSENMDVESFANILKAYCKFRNKPVIKLNESMRIFEEKIADQE